MAKKRSTLVAEYLEKSPLATGEQEAVEKVVLQVLDDAQVRGARSDARKILEKSSLSQLADGKARLDYALDAWLNFLAFQEVTADPARPSVIWAPNGATYSWFGHTMPQAGASIDCPDNIYRLIAIDPSSRYEIYGRLRPTHPTQFSFQLLRDADLTPSGADNAVLGALNSRDMVIAPNGSFTITIDSDPANGRSNHLQTQPDPLLRILIRDTLSSWLQNANELRIERIGAPPAGPARDKATIAAGVAGRLSDWVNAWLSYISKLHGPPQDNVLVPPYGRTGGWGYISFVRFNLADDEAIVFTVDDGAAEYAGGQITDVWGILTDPQKYLSSYAVGQSMRNDDATYTYIVAPRDPHTANWLDTAGMHRGWFAFRWQGMPRTRTSSDGLVRDFKVVKVGELTSILPAALRNVTPDRRQREKRSRSDEWRLRIATGTKSL
jgi:hypothetical protein